MSIANKIIDYINRNGSVSGKQLTEYLGISRQALNKHIKKLVQSGKIVKEGNTKGTVYKISGGKKKKKKISIRRIYDIQNLEEDRVFRQLSSIINLKKLLSKNVFDIFQFCFTEILNNAIEHSKSEKSSVEIVVDDYNVNFLIRDYGIGVFYSIYKKFDLDSEYEAVLELIKGKTTTMKEKHSGEGIFFTSKITDVLSLRSHRINLIFDNIRNDVFLEEKRYIEGTEVNFTINRRSKKKFQVIFDKYAPEKFDYRFEKTKVSVKLFGESYISRSEARRLLFNLDKFTEIVLDFKGVKSIGQGFADEIFRVFKNSHPEIAIKVENLSVNLRKMISHIVDNNI